MLNLIWSGFFIVAFILAIVKSLHGDFSVWQQISASLFDSADSGFRISIGLTGVLCLWLGLLKIAEKSGLTEVLAKLLRPFFHAIMPDLKKDSPAFGSIVMNVAANILGLDNAATPMGLKAFAQMQKENPHPDRASNSQIMFMVLNSSSLTLLPITILMYRYQFGSANPALVFIPILLATSVSTLAGFLATAVYQKINIFKPIVLSYLLGGMFLIGGIGFCFFRLSPDSRINTTMFISNAVLFGLAALFIVWGLLKKQNVYENFIEGAKEGFSIAIQIIPYLVAMLVAIGVFRAAGGLEAICSVLEKIMDYFAINHDFVKALPTAFMKPLSGSGARAMMLDTFKTYGVDSFAGFASSIVQGSTETTFYVLAVYFGSVKISKTGAALPLALFADFCGVIAAIALAYFFYQE